MRARVLGSVRLARTTQRHRTENVHVQAQAHEHQPRLNLMDDPQLFFNGIDADSGSYLVPPATTAELAAIALGGSVERGAAEEALLGDLAKRLSDQKSHFGLKEGLDPAKLEEAGWGVIFPAVDAGSDEEKRQAAIYDALRPLLELRRAQASANNERYYREYRGDSGYRRGETKQQYLARFGVGAGPADPDKMPYYLLIVGSPQVIPFHVQYQIDVQYAVGRIDFDTVEDYANYARSVVAAESGGAARAREVAFLGVANADDPATRLSREHLVGPLADLVERRPDLAGWRVRRCFDQQADKATAARLIGGAETPALLFSASHGVGFRKGDPRQARHQGALLLDDWPGPMEWRKPLREELYLSGDDLGDDARMHGLIAFTFACFGAGTPELEDYARQAGRAPRPIAERAFLSGLTRRMLSHPRGGALAAVGHVERAWGCSFLLPSGEHGAPQGQLAVFESAMAALMKGLPVGAAMEYFNQRYAELASDLASAIPVFEFGTDPDPAPLANLWTSTNDARGYAIVGDPAVRLRFDEGGGARAAQGDAGAVVASGTAPAPRGQPPVDGRATGGEVDAGEAGAGEAAGALAAEVARALRVVFAGLDAIEVTTRGTSGAVASTRIAPDGSIDSTVPDGDGAIDTALRALHHQQVLEAQARRTEVIRAAIEAMAGRRDR